MNTNSYLEMQRTVTRNWSAVLKCMCMREEERIIVLSLSSSLLGKIINFHFNLQKVFSNTEYEGRCSNE